MFNSLLGSSNGGGNGRYKDNLPNVSGGVMFDKADAAGDFKNQLMPLPAAATVTQQQEDEGLRSLPSPWLPKRGGGDNNPCPHPHINQLG